MPRVTVAENAGFCFGVKRAADLLEAALAEGGKTRLFTLGHLIHNATYNARLAARGVEAVTLEQMWELAAKATPECPQRLFVRAHGIPRETEEALRELCQRYPDFSYEDCTCPLVKKIHRIAEEQSGDQNIFILFGDRHHPEVVGIMSYFAGEKYVFDSPESFFRAVENHELCNLDKKTPIFALQTTYNLSNWKKTQKFIKKYCTNAIIFDTICSVTEKRQTEAEALARESDMMLVVGGSESSNTAKLADICAAHCAITARIETARQLDDLAPNIYTHEKVGIVAGASTPGDVIEEVYRKMSEQENFAQMLDESFKTLNTGDTVTGIVTRVTDTDLQLDLGTKVTGMIKAEQITDDPSVKLTEQFKVGDSVEAFVIRVSDVEGVAELSKKRVDADKNWTKIVEASANGDIVEGKITGAVKGGVVALVDSVRVFIPASQSGVPMGGDMNVLVGTTQRMKVIEVKEYGKKAIGSIRTVLREEQKAREAEFWANIEEGKQYTGKVKSMTSYGAFVDLGGVDGMVHATELSWKRIKSPADVVAIGDEITVFVKSFDAEKKRISLGYKTEESNPWVIFRHTYGIGDVVSVKIVNMMPFGAFAEIVDGVDGLIHISQIAQKRIAKPADALELGQVVDAKIIDIDDDNHKVSLSIRVLLDEAQAEAEAMPEEETVAEAAETAEVAEETAVATAE